MPSTTCAMNSRRAARAAALTALLAAAPGCGKLNNVWVDDSPPVASLNSPTALDVEARFPLAPQRVREWASATVAPESGAVIAGPTYFEDPFVDKGSGHTGNYTSWVDYVAMPYGLGRFTLNWLGLPASMVVTPPWTPMESDGELSPGLLGLDHDAEPVAARRARMAAASQAASAPEPTEPSDVPIVPVPPPPPMPAPTRGGP